MSFYSNEEKQIGAIRGVGVQAKSQTGGQVQACSHPLCQSLAWSGIATVADCGARTPRSPTVTF